MPTYRMIACVTEGCCNLWSGAPNSHMLSECVKTAERQGWVFLSGIGILCPHCAQTIKAAPEPIPKDPAKECRLLLREVAHALAGRNGNATYADLSEVFGDIGQEPF